MFIGLILSFILKKSKKIYFAFLARFTGSLFLNIRKALLIGGEGLCFSKDFVQNNSNTTLDIVELDFKLTQISKRQSGITLQPFYLNDKHGLNSIVIARKKVNITSVSKY